jgi:adenine-specific DNA-methyltransferase
MRLLRSFRQKQQSCVIIVQVIPCTFLTHKDLGVILNRELDFFIKNEVQNLDDIGDATFEITEQQHRKIKILRSIAKKFIRMLAQLEDFQKKLW